MTLAVELLCTRQAQLWHDYEALLAMGRAGVGSEAEATVLRRMDWWQAAELEWRWHRRILGRASGKGDCIWGAGEVCPDAVVCCTVCAVTGRWQDTDMGGLTER
tara:strand:- start:2805 stop:3116 length:312 start_codon:yes stop_codon:yes gene_type:complete